MPTTEQRTAVRAARATAGAAYAAAVDALVAAYVELFAYDEVCGSAVMSNHAGMPGQPLSFQGSIGERAPFILHKEFATAHPAKATVEAAIRQKVQDILDEDLA